MDCRDEQKGSVIVTELTLRTNEKSGNTDGPGTRPTFPSTVTSRIATSLHKGLCTLSAEEQFPVTLTLARLQPGFTFVRT